MTHCKSRESTLLGYFYVHFQCRIWVHPIGSRAVEHLLDFFRCDTIGQHLVDVFRPDAVVGGNGFQVFDVTGLGILDSLPDGRAAVISGPVGVAQEDLGVIELGASHVAGGIDAEDLTAVQLDLAGFAQLHVQLLQGGFEDGFSAGIDVEIELFIVVQANRVLTLDQIQVIVIGHNGDGEGTLQLLGHARQRRKRQLPGSFEELYSDVTVGFDLGGRQVMLAAQPLVVGQDTIMSEGEVGTACLAAERVIILIKSLASLRGHTGMSHDEVGVLMDLEPEQMGRQGTLVDLEGAAGVVGDSGRICTPLLAGHGQNGQDLGLFLTAQLVAVIQDSEQTAHNHTS